MAAPSNKQFAAFTVVAITLGSIALLSLIGAKKNERQSKKEVDNRLRDTIVDR